MGFNSWQEVKDFFDIDINLLIDEAFKTQSVQKTMIEFNQDQLQDGKDALGQTINTIGGSPYRPYTVVIRKSKGLPTNRVTLKDTGDFYKTFKVVILSDGYEITADFNKPDGSILDNFSSSFDFLGLDAESINELVQEHVLPLVSQMLRKQLGL
jgi:hypothetical protein